VSRQVKDLLQERVRAGATVILTTHILEVAERIADRIGIIQAGKLLAEGTLTELRERAGERDGTLEDVFLELTGEATAEPAAA
jgi:ABC-2 type transport system ATP-binding protein